MNQSLTDIEIIVVNDCTPDNSMAIVRELAEADMRIQIIENQKNRGLMMTRKVAYGIAKGDYITFCDSDDTMPQNALKDLYEAAVETGADIVAGAMEYVPVKGERQYKTNKLSYGSDSIGMYRSLLTDEMNQNLCSKLFLKSLLQGFDYQTYENATYGEDGNLNYQVVEHIHKCVTIDSVVYEYRQNEESATHTRKNEKALISLTHLQEIRYGIALRHPELKKLIFRKISLVYLESKLDEDLEPYFKAAGLDQFTHFVPDLMRQKFFVAVKYLIRYVYHKKRG